MGLFDSLAGQVLRSVSNGGAAHHAGLIDVIGGLLNNPQTGGLAGLIAMFEQKGFGGIVASWVGTGQNLPISAEQLQSVLGSEQIRAIAQKLGLAPQEVSVNLAELLPPIVDKMTPGGTVPQGGLSAGLLGALNDVFN